MNKQNRLILIDGSAYIFRAYYGLPPMNRADGTPINAVFGFTNMLVKLIEDYRDDKMIVIFDAARENFRNTIFKDYKANRGETPEDLIPQFEIIRECVDAFNIPQLEIEGYEADDIIATYCKLAEKKKIDSIIQKAKWIKKNPKKFSNKFFAQRFCRDDDCWRHHWHRC